MSNIFIRYLLSIVDLFGSVAEFVGNPGEDGGLTTGGTMSFSL
jgi:hypothetical protein